jgi:hypothetical protein
VRRFGKAKRGGFLLRRPPGRPVACRPIGGAIGHGVRPCDYLPTRSPASGGVLQLQRLVARGRARDAAPFFSGAREFSLFAPARICGQSGPCNGTPKETGLLVTMIGCRGVGSLGAAQLVAPGLHRVLRSAAFCILACRMFP